MKTAGDGWDGGPGPGRAGGAGRPGVGGRAGVGGRPGSAPPFRREGLLIRGLPFALVAVLAELSLALPPGPASLPATVASAALLAAALGAALLPWHRLPSWLPAAVPLLYTASVVPLILATGSTGSGITVVLLIPLAWTALFHRPWESSLVIAAIVTVVVVVSIFPDQAPDSVIARRVFFWGALATMIAVAAHGLRARVRRSQQAAARLQARLRELSIMADRDRIASSLQDTVVQRLFAAGLSLQGISLLTGVPEVNRRIEQVVGNLDEAIRLLRQSIFGLEHGLPEQGLRRSILDLTAEVTPALGIVPEVTLDGPIDTTVPPELATHLLAALREALSTSGATARASRVAVTVSAGPGEVILTVTDDGTRWAGRTTGDGPQLDRLRERARRLGGTAHTGAGPAGGARLTWRVPLRPGPRLAGEAAGEGDAARPDRTGTDSGRDSAPTAQGGTAQDGAAGDGTADDGRGNVGGGNGVAAVP